MKAAISIPDEIFQKAEQLARRMKKSRSELFTRALDEYLARHSSDQVTDAMNEVCEDLDPKPDTFVTAATSRILERSDW